MSQHGHMGFVGVSTQNSSIMKVFPLWAEILELPTKTLRGYDVPLDATEQDYRDLVTQLRSDPSHFGALVTTHKMKLYDAAAPLFDEIDPFGVACREISSISKPNGKLVGRAKDPITVGLALDDFLPATYFAERGAEVLILGAGGSGTALSWALAHRTTDAPAKVTVTAHSAAKLDALRAIYQALGTPEDVMSYVAINSAEQTDLLVEGLPPGSLVVNATGLGKDRPGSPVTDAVVFPTDGYVWEFNYRGSLEFLSHARNQQATRNLAVIDGWRYFIHGWSQVIADVFDVTLTPAIVETLAASAETVRTG